MATEDEKKRNLVKLSSFVIHGLTKGLWDLLGESANVTAKMIGDKNVEMLEKEMGFEIVGEDPNEMLLELNRLFVDELGALDEADAVVEGDKITVTYKGCKFMALTKDLMDDGIPPFICPFKGMAMASIKKRLGKDVHSTESDVNTTGKVCVHKFEIL
jgi:hypothetical protein